jgi:hypothetical protein
VALKARALKFATPPTAETTVTPVGAVAPVPRVEVCGWIKDDDEPGKGHGSFKQLACHLWQ